MYEFNLKKLQLLSYVTALKADEAYNTKLTKITMIDG